MAMDTPTSRNVTGLLLAWGQGDKEALAVSKQIVPTVNIKKDNVAEFSARLKKLVGK